MRDRPLNILGNVLKVCIGVVLILDLVDFLCAVSEKIEPSAFRQILQVDDFKLFHLSLSVSLSSKRERHSPSPCMVVFLQK